jgi:uncharacterized protein (DUF2267 family)
MNQTNTNRSDRVDKGLFENTIQKTNLWLKEIKEELHFDTLQEAYAALRAVLHALRDRLTVEEAAELGSQLPMLIRGFYYEGWSPAHKPLKMRTAQEFLDYVGSEFFFNRQSNKDARYITTGILRILEKHITQGEIRDVKQGLPDEILGLWREPMRVG